MSVLAQTLVRKDCDPPELMNLTPLGKSDKAWTDGLIRVLEIQSYPRKYQRMSLAAATHPR
jgi:hypothetical protein